jgi:phosphopantetheinyl transferase
MSYYINLSICHGMYNNLHRIERQKILSAEARRILSMCEGRPITEDDIAREQTGRPFFRSHEGKDPDTDFSVSHSGALTAVSLVRGKNLRTSCDVERVRPRSGAQEIADFFFTVPERDYIASGGRFDETRFYEIWTLKECFLKLRGLSVFDIGRTPSFISGVEPAVRGSYTFDFIGVSPVMFNLYELTGCERYILATAIEPQPSGECRVEPAVRGSPFEGTELEQPEIRWFSQDYLACKSIANITS